MMTSFGKPTQSFRISRQLCCCILVLFSCMLMTIIEGMVIENTAQDSLKHDGNRLLVNRRNSLGKIAAFSIFCAVDVTPFAARSLSPEEAAVAYDSYAETYDDLDGGKASSLLGIEEARNALFREASGSVLEIGAGTGLNLNKYDLTKIASITLVDVSQGMLNEAKKRVQETPSLRDGCPISFVQADATSDLVDLFGKQKFDCVAGSFCLCVMGNDGAKKCLDQVRQIVKSKTDGGKVLILENSRSSNPLLGMYQDATADAAASAGGKGCVYNQDVAALIRNTKGMTIENEQQYAAGLFRAYRCAVE
jgi:methyltransferase OMS1